MTNDSIVYDKQGKRVQRANGVLADGDRMTVPITLMDSASRTAALTLLDSGTAPSQEQLEILRDARNRDLEHRWQGGTQQDTQPASHSSADLIAARDRRVSEMWKQH
ncbi:hypothetical protein [Bradyrhizobium sp. 1]|uniref:hypothetical protein n=1 Tax=Bradyrhizobium sp. 1 TaxID=241591 RepID=UPI001FF84CB6|nr:hypothetical protein [Bradyrhizobium sp. 1]MCK1391694.1 hypothetical protein [Bradyrhizobium sp. 1]